MTPKTYPQNIHTPTQIHFTEKPKNIEIQNFEPPKNGPSLRMYENIRVPPPSLLHFFRAHVDLIPLLAKMVISLKCVHFSSRMCVLYVIIQPRHEISKTVLYATSKRSDQPSHTRSLIRAFPSRLISL